METIITKEFGVEAGANYIHALCYKNKYDENCLTGQISNIGIGYMRDEQMLIVTGDAHIYPNEGGGMTYAVKKVMTVKKFRKAFQTMCEELDKGKSVIW